MDLGIAIINLINICIYLLKWLMKTSTVLNKANKIELNDYFTKALDLLENTSKNVFITGRAGTGKSTLLDYFRNTTKKKAVVLAPTGVAALNVKGQTIHSFFGFKPDVSVSKIKKIDERKVEQKKNIYKEADLFVIDEISMVRSDLMDCIDKFLRLNGKDSAKPFGGAQLAFIGDLYQLPPVVSYREKEIFMSQYESPYFFSAKVFAHFDMEFIELEKIYRQKDDHFIKLLNSIRNKSLTDTDLDNLNKRLIPDFQPKSDDLFIYLTTTNQMADEINYHELNRLDTDIFSFSAVLDGNFDMRLLPTQIDLDVKVGAQVMFLNNDTKDRWVNGSIGKVVDILVDKDGEFDEPYMIVELQNGREVEVEPHTWDIYNFSYNKEKKSIDTEVVGSFTQFPLRLAWAVTIHKSQGKTFEKVIIDIGRGTFSHGQVYVALSRCTSLEGIILKRPIEKKHIWMDFKVVDFLTKYQYKIAEQNCSYEDKEIIIKDAIESGTDLEIVYLKANDTKTRRKITPLYIDEMQFKGKSFIGLRALCKMRQEERTFRIDRILEILSWD